MSSPLERHLAVDLHKHYLVVGGVNTRQEVVLPPRRIDLDRWPPWAQANLCKSDVLVVEATTNTWDFYDQTLPFVGQLLVADPRQVAWIAKTRVKTDPSDVLKLARLSAAHLVPTVWVPPPPVRELRALLAHRRRLIKTQTMLKNRLHSLLHRHHLVPPVSDPFGPKYETWWSELKVSPTEQLHVRHDLATLAQLATQIAEIDDELRRLSCESPWAADVPYLLQLPGVGLIVAMTVLAAVGDITRFESAKNLVGYSGLGTSVHDSGLTHRTGRITKEGRKELRYVLVEAAWRAVDCSDYWRLRFQKLCQRMDEHKAIVAIAHELLIVIWHVLTERAVDQQANPDLVAFKFTHAVQCSRDVVVEVDRRPARRPDHPPVRARPLAALAAGREPDPCRPRRVETLDRAARRSVGAQARTAHRGLSRAAPTTEPPRSTPAQKTRAGWTLGCC